jgi:hypothetical protein
MLRTPLPENAAPSICLTNDGITIEDSDEHPAKALHSIRSSLESDSKITSPSRPQPSKQFEQRIITLLGIQIDDSDEQHPKTSDSIRESFESDSKLTSPRVSHFQKHFEQRIVTLLGIQIEDSDEQYAKTSDSIRQIFDSFPNAIVETERHPKKHPSDRIWRSIGILTHDSQPKYTINELCSESTRNDPTTKNVGEFASTRMSRRAVPRNADPPIFLAEPGIEIEVSDPHIENANGSISRRSEMASNRIELTQSHPENEFSQMR